MDTQQGITEAKKKIFYGWKVLPALFAVGALGPMTRYSLTAFFPALSAELGWSRSEIGLAQSSSLWIYSFVAIITGWMVDRIGGRKTIFIGGLSCLIGWLLFSTVSSLWQLYVYYGLIMAIATSNTHLVPTQGTSRKWFVRRAGLASGIVGSALALGNSTFVPLLTSTSAVFGWRTVSIASAFAFSIPILLLAYFVIRDTPESIGQHPDGDIYPPGAMERTTSKGTWSVKDALKTPQLWLLFLAYGLYGMVMNALLAHIVVWAVDLGSSPAAAGFYVTLMNGPSIFLRVAGGWLGDKYGKKKIMAAGVLLSMVAMLAGWQIIHTQYQLLFFIPILGILTSLGNTLFAPYLGDLFGRERVGSLFAILTFSWGMIGGFGPIIWGLIFDSTKSYSLALLVSAIGLAIALAALLFIRPLPEKTK